LSGIEPATPGQTLPEVHDRLARLQSSLHDIQRLLGACAVTVFAGSLVTLRVGREQEALIKASGLQPHITSELEALETTLGELEAVMLEVMGGGK